MRIPINILLATCYLLFTTYGFAQVNSDSLILVYTNKMQKYLDKENKASEVLSFTKDGIEVYAPATDTFQRKYEFKISWKDITFFKNILSAYSYLRIKQMLFDSMAVAEVNVPGIIKRDLSKPLLHYSIALDPGHIGGDIETARMEKKWVEMKANPAKGIKEPIQLIEGDLTFVTAKILKKKLESKGAKVMLTRNELGISAFGITYKKWKDSLFLRSVDSAYARKDVSFEEKNFLLTKANDTEIFRRFFLQEEIYERARKINEFNPTLTLIIHYNVDETNQNWNKPTKKDFNMAFVGGSFGADELVQPEARIDFLRLLLTEDIEKSIDFSKYIVEGLVQKTGIPSATDSCAIYLRDNCMTTGVNGVFCRNLALTRMVKGALCYGESLYQDNINECKALSKNEITVDEMKSSKRVEEVAEGYFQGIINYMKSKNAEW